MSSEKYAFKNKNGKTLAGRLEFPDQEPKAFAVFAHCFTCTKDFIASRTITQDLAQKGIASLRFDFAGLGGSQGDFKNTSFTSNVEDLIYAAAALGKTHKAPKLLIGHSLGGAAVLSAAPYIDSVTAIATLAAPFDPSHILHLFAQDIESIEKDGEACVDLSGRDFTISRNFIEDLNQQDQRQRIASMHKALLVMHSPTDQMVGIENAQMIYEAAQHPKSFISLDNMDHLLTNSEDIAYVAGLLSSWAVRYIHKKPSPIRTLTKIYQQDKKVRITPTGNGPFSFMIHAGSHHFLTDEPIALGGKNTGPPPYDFLLAALGSCTAITLRMYAERKNIKLEEVRIELSQEPVQNQGDKNPDAQKQAYKVSRILSLSGDLTEAQKQELLEIANQCPVHQTLKGEVIVSTHLRTG